jgi:hypothetical protein
LIIGRKPGIVGSRFIYEGSSGRVSESSTGTSWKKAFSYLVLSSILVNIKAY